MKQIGVKYLKFMVQATGIKLLMLIKYLANFLNYKIICEVMPFVMAFTHAHTDIDLFSASLFPVVPLVLFFPPVLPLLSCL